jgi:hypothetical protein
MTKPLIEQSGVRRSVNIIGLLIKYSYFPLRKCSPLVAKTSFSFVSNLIHISFSC